MRIVTLVIAVFCLVSCNNLQHKTSKIASPDNNLEINFNVSKDGSPFYYVKFKNETVIDTSFLGFDFIDKKSLKDNFEIVNTKTSTFNETWQMPWGEQLDVVNNYTELKVELKEKSTPNRKLNIVFKAYNNGIGFRYEFPEQENWKEALIREENTEFNLTQDFKTFWIPANWDSYENLYQTTQLSEVNAVEVAKKEGLPVVTVPVNAVNTPVTMVGKNGLHLSFHEAALVDYSGMTLSIDTKNLDLKSHLVGAKNANYKVKRSLPFTTPWRTVQIADNAPDLIASKLIVNLNEPNKLGDVSWVKPMKYVGIWWEMHLKKSSWAYGMSLDENENWIDTGKRNPKHGATTENTKKFIDFAAKNNMKGVLVEGWNTGWDRKIKVGLFDYVTPYPDYDLEEVSRYAKEKGVEIIMHHETSAAVATYEKQQDTAYALMKKHGMHSLKSGYVGKIEGGYHHGQYMVNQYNNAAIKAAKYKIAVNAHEPIKATGLRRTYPNIISREGVRGQEFNAWSPDGGNPPEHLPIVAFTRMLSGPIDFTPGIFNIKLDGFRPNNQVNTTLAKQLALYVVIYSPVQMAADLIEHYEANPAVFQFIKDVGVNWEETKVLNGEVGDFVTIARKERETGNWFVGSITDQNKRDIDMSFSFLDDHQEYEATIYKDGKNAHWNKNPLDLAIEKISINNKTKLTLKLAEGGGFAISLIKK
ncbi:glycoside hydrolase family 97 protein [Polaribacter haliotis]|uniref:Glycoside hydrolase family 97 protein n=2 Tax=Polaribacter haliotis TaxID=1888915 RepID=A0A7L8AKW6_9FLAO|nr:glycoside hydrolase family 97 protein [Polaribacter haliotis]